MSLRTYEALYIVFAHLSDDEIQTVASGVEELITSSGGAIVRSENWGKRRLAYVVKAQKDGVYILVRFQAETDFIDQLESRFRLSEHILRPLVSLFAEKTLRL